MSMRDRVNPDELWKYAKIAAVVGVAVYSTYVNAKQVPTLTENVQKHDTRIIILEKSQDRIERSLERIEGYLLDLRGSRRRGP